MVSIPCNYWGTGFVVVHIIYLFTTMYAKACFVLGDHIGRKVAFSMHRPYCWDDVIISWYFTTIDKYPMHLFNMGIDFLEHGINKLWGVRLSYGLVHMHNVAHHLCMGCKWVENALLKFKLSCTCC